DAEGLAQQVEARLIELGQPLVARLEQLAQRLDVAAEERRRAVGVAQRREVRVRPPLARGLEAVVDLLVDDALFLRLLDDRHAEPARFVVDAHHGAVLVVAALELHVVEQDERVDLRHAVQVPEPRQVMRLVNGDDHWIGRGYGGRRDYDTGILCAAWRSGWPAGLCAGAALSVSRRRSPTRAFRLRSACPA